MEEHWYEDNLQHVKSENFDSSTLSDIVSEIDTFFEKHLTVPSVKILDKIFSSKYNNPKTKDILYNIKEELNNIQNVSVSNAEKIFITEKTVEFSINQNIKKSIFDSATAYEMGDIDSVKKVYEDVLAFSNTSSKYNYSVYFEDKDLLRYTKEYIEKSKIPTLYSTIDKKLRGGITRKELGIILAPPYRGKTATLINLGTNALYMGINVLHITLENSQDNTLTRYDMCLTGTTYEEIVNSPKKFSKKIESFKSLHKGRLIVQEFPSRSLSVNELHSFIKMLVRREDFTTDLLILDYVDELKVENSRELTTYAIGNNVSKLRGLCSTMNISCWTATQGTRSSLSKITLDMDDVADSWDKAKIADIIIALCQTKKEELDNLMRLMIIKNRNNARFSAPIHFQTKFNIMKLKERTEYKTKEEQ